MTKFCVPAAAKRGAQCIAFLVALSLTGPVAAGSIAFIAKAGTFKVSKDRQIIDGGLVIIDDSASGVFGLELEWRQTDGIAFGLEYVQYENDVSTTGSSLRSTMDTVAILGNVKKYFRPTATVNPYIGAGIGAAAIDFNGDLITGSAGGLAAQMMGGVEFQWEKVGLYTELKYLYAEPEDDFNQKAKGSGTGAFAGIRIAF